MRGPRLANPKPNPNPNLNPNPNPNPITLTLTLTLTLTPTLIQGHEVIMIDPEADSEDLTPPTPPPAHLPADSSSEGFLAQSEGLPAQM